MIGKRLEILLVEDNPGDVDLVREALADAGPLGLAVARDGVEALAYLHREGPHAARPTPDLVLLDLNLPRRDGRDVLREMKEDPALRSIPVVVLTSSAAESDLANAYALHANCFVVKPVDLEKFVETVRALERFWSEVATLPPPGV